MIVGLTIYFIKDGGYVIYLERISQELIKICLHPELLLAV